MTNLSARVLSGVVFVPLFIWMILEGRYIFLIFVLALVTVGLNEFYTIAIAKGAHPSRWEGLSWSLLLFLIPFFRLNDILPLILTAFIFIIPTIRIFQRRSESALLDIGTTILGVFFVGWLGSYLIWLREISYFSDDISYQVGAKAVLLCVWITWMGDTSAYFVGKYFGKHPLNRTISPKKTWEGAVGGFVFSVLAALGARWIGFNELTIYMSWVDSMMLGIIGGIVGPIGDLTESLFKRDAQIKESATFIPGHGGVLDRFDSLFFTAPFFYYYLSFIIFQSM